MSTATPKTLDRRYGGAVLRRAALCATVAACLAVPAAAQAAGEVYISLGDSYTAAPFVPVQDGRPPGCARSNRNYPSLVSRALKTSAFVDRSCSGAETVNMTQPQLVAGNGANPPQFEGLRGDADIVTVGIGGNDAGLIGVATKCIELGFTDPNGQACRNYWAPGGRDRVAARIEAAKPKIAATLQGIHDRSPTARVAIVGYPHVLPDSGNCYSPNVPLSVDDIAYLRELLGRINSMIAGQAAANEVEYVDTYADSAGHDVCKAPGNRWFEGLVPSLPAAPLHPNALGEASMSRSVLGVLDSPRPVPVLSSLSISPRHLRVGSRARISFRLNQFADVFLTVRRLYPGRQVGRRCLLPTRARAGRRPCRRVGRARAMVSTDGFAGRSSFRRTSHGLGGSPGLYRITAEPTTYGASGRTQKATYRVLPARRRR